MSSRLLAGISWVRGARCRVPDLLDKAMHSRLVDEARMHFLYAASLDHFADVALPNSAASHDRDPIVCLVHQFGDDIRSIECRRFPTGSQDALNADVYELLERPRRISHHIECAVEGDLAGTRRYNESARFCHGDATFSRQGTRHDSIGAKVASRLDVFEDRLDFFHRVDEITGARPNQDEERNPDSSGNR
jgi:hypothetical protein